MVLSAMNLAQPSLLSKMNERQVLRVLQTHGPLSRADVAESGTVRAPAKWPTNPVTVDTYDDHRMAMCFSLASFGPTPVRINDPQCVAKTFPQFFAELEKISA